MRRGELQIYESVLVIFFFILMFLLGFIFFNKYTVDNIKEQALKYEELKFQELTAIIPSMYEFRCSFSFSDDECIDLSKVWAFNRISKDYFNIFGYKKISIKEVYPGEEEEILVYEKVPKKYKTRRIISSPISIYNIKDDTYKVGLLKIEWYY